MSAEPKVKVIDVWPGQTIEVPRDCDWLEVRFHSPECIHGGRLVLQDGAITLIEWDWVRPNDRAPAVTLPANRLAMSVTIGAGGGGASARVAVGGGGGGSRAGVAVGGGGGGAGHTH